MLDFADICKPVPNDGFLKKPKHVASFGQVIA